MHRLRGVGVGFTVLPPSLPQAVCSCSTLFAEYIPQQQKSARSAESSACPQPQHQPLGGQNTPSPWPEGPPPREEELVLSARAAPLSVPLLQGLTKPGASYKGVAASKDTSQQGTRRRPSGHSVLALKPTDGNGLLSQPWTGAGLGRKAAFSYNLPPAPASSPPPPLLSLSLTQALLPHLSLRSQQNNHGSDL